jgi:hypothetical protein
MYLIVFPPWVVTVFGAFRIEVGAAGAFSTSRERQVRLNVVVL